MHWHLKQDLSHWRCYALIMAVCLLSAVPSSSAEHAESLPSYRIEYEGFGDREADIRALCDSVIREFWSYFPGYELEPFVIERGRKGPIVLYKRNARGEIQMRLDTGDTLWAQYAYQFAHEFCHILCKFEEDFPGNKWFEETLCEAASLFAMRAMSKSWAKDPPYSNWKSYRHNLASYADDVIRGNDRIREIYEKGLSGFYLVHKQELTANPTRRDLNGAMAIVLLHLLEQEPKHWEAVRWINHASSPEGETFADYLSAWHRAVPSRHKSFVAEIARLYGIKIELQE